MELIQNFIGGEFAPSLGGERLLNYEPSRGRVYGEAVNSDAEDIKAAIQSASQAFPKWSSLPVQERAAWLKKVAARIIENQEALALAESKDTGKPLSLARSLDIPRAAQNFSFFAEEILKFQGREFVTALENGTRAVNSVQHQPLGVVACISPWNLPLYLLTWKIAPALAAGNTVVAKPSEVTPMTAFLLSKILKEMEFPPGVINIVHGTGARVGTELVQNHLVKAVSFTGSTKVGREISTLAAPLFKKVSLEMGGKNPTMIFSDADLDAAVKGAVRGAFLNQGQICLCGSRILVEEKIYDEFLAKFLSQVKKLKVGDPYLEGTDQGAVVSQAHFEKVLNAIDIAKREGGRCLIGGEPVRFEGELAKGWYVAPAVFEGLDQNCKTNQDEIFGPVVTIQKFSNEAEAIENANSTRYGLSASIWSQNGQRIERVSMALQAGIVWANTWMLRDLRTPFGGVKESGVGREGGEYALQFFSETKNVCRYFEKESEI